MKKQKRFLALLLAVAAVLGLSACGSSADGNDADEIVGDDWRVTGIVRDSGTITRDGEDTDVLVCVNTEDAAFYYDTEEQTLFDLVEYPGALAGDAWEMFRSIDFADRTGDGNSDVAMIFEDGGNTVLMVWFWDRESEAFVFQPEESQLTADEEENG